MTTERTPLIAGNWKMNGLAAAGSALATDLAARMKEAGQMPFEMLVCPPMVQISDIAGILEGSGIRLGAQDCHGAENGAHTGDIAAPMIKDAGASYVIVGHSERRCDHGETDALVNAKASAAIAAGLCAVICVGETESQRDAGDTLAVIKGQIAASVPTGATKANTVLAYEPVWAIGTGRTPTNDEVQEVHAFIRGQLAVAIGEDEAAGVRILYGGSMKPGNARELIALADVDGGLIGGASLKAEDFWAIAATCL